MANKTTRRHLSVLFNLLLALCVPISLFAGVVIFVVYSHEISQMPGLEWFTPIENYFQDAETPLPVAMVVIAFALAFLVTYILSFPPRYPRRPMKRLLFLDILLAAVVAVYIVAAISPLYELMAAILIGIPLLGWLLEHLAGKILARVATWLVEREQWAQANAVLAMALRFRPDDIGLQRGLGLARYDAGDVVDAIDLLEHLPDKSEPRIIGILEECHHTERNWEKALEYGRKILKADPESDAQRMRVASVLEKLDRRDEAISLLAEALPSENMDLIEELIRLHVEAGNAEAAEGVLVDTLEKVEPGSQPRCLAAHQHLAEAFAGNPLLLEGLANFLIRHRKREEGFSLIEKIVEISPHRHDLRTRLVRKYQEDGLIDKAESHLTALMDAGRDTVDIALLYGDMLIQREEYDKALMHFQYAVENYRDDYRFAYFLAQISLRTQALEDAMRWCEEALRRAKEEEERARVRTLRGRVEENMVTRDLQVLQDRCRRDPDNVEMHMQLLQAMVRHRMTDQAVGEYEALLESHPELQDRVIGQLEELTESGETPFRIMDYLFDLRLQRRQWDEAEQLALQMAERSLHGDDLLEERCQAILRLYPQHQPTLFTVADLSFRRQNWSRFLDIESQLEELGVAPDAQRLENVFEAASQLRDFRRAASAAERLIERRPADVALRVRASDLYATMADFDKAQEHLREAQKRDFHNAEVVKRMQGLAKKRRDHRLKEIEESLAQSPDDADANHLEAGDIYIAMDQAKKAVGHYQAVAPASPLRNLARGKLARAMAQLGMFDLVDETLAETKLDVTDNDEAQRLKAIVYEIADLYEGQAEHDRAVNLFKKIFRVDAAYRDVVDRIELLSN